MSNSQPIKIESLDSFFMRDDLLDMTSELMKLAFCPDFNLKSRIEKFISEYDSAQKTSRFRETISKSLFKYLFFSVARENNTAQLLPDGFPEQLARESIREFIDLYPNLICDNLENESSPFTEVYQTLLSLPSTGNLDRTQGVLIRVLLSREGEKLSELQKILHVRRKISVVQQQQRKRLSTDEMRYRAYVEDGYRVAEYVYHRGIDCPLNIGKKVEKLIRGHSNFSSDRFSFFNAQ